MMFAAVCHGSTGRLQAIDYALVSGDRLEFTLKLDGTAGSVRDFQTESPYRIVLDLPGITNGLDQRTIPVQRAGVNNLQVVEAYGRTRIVLNLDHMQAYTIRAEGSRIILALQGAQPSGQNVQASPSLGISKTSRPPAYTFGTTRELGEIDFRRGQAGEGRVMITLGDPKNMVDIQREGVKVAIHLPDAILPQRLSRRLDVIDFATPVHFIEAMREPGGTKVLVTPVSDRYEFSSYQSGGLLTVEFRALSERQRESSDRNKSIVYSGNKLTLNFQDIAIRSVLQILADFTHVNIVASDAVDGNVTLRLQDVPWDQALDLVLKSRGLGKRQEGNIIRVAPLAELNKEEQEKLENLQVYEELEPLRTQVFQINYTTAEAIKKILQGQSSSPKPEADTDQNPTDASGQARNTEPPTLSARGNITADPRTNQLIVLETSRNIERISELIRYLDKPVRQVLIESRIVIATNDFSRELGARLALNRSSAIAQIQKDIPPTPNYNQSGTYGNALVDLASTAAAASGGYFGVTFLKVGDYILDLELSAAQVDDRIEIVSTPKVVATDGTQAYILQGEQIPYSQNNALGASNTQFKDAVLELKVTPHITADENILMNLSVKKNAPGVRQYSNGNVGIEKREILTTAQVSNGETMVLGGVFEGDQEGRTDKVPFLGDLPGVGFMFRRNMVTDKKRELLIFITPKIIGSELVNR